jgi:hypothetical protein
MHVLDAAEVTWRALTVPAAGFHRVFVAAPQILAPYATEDLIAAFHPGTPVCCPLPGRTVPIDLTAGERLLGFTARHVVEVADRRLPATEG